MLTVNAASGFGSGGKTYLKFGSDEIPTMSSTTAPSGIVTSSSDTGGYWDWYAFEDGSVDPSKRWDSNVTIATDNAQYIGYEFAGPKLIQQYTIRQSGSGQGPSDWTFEGWNGSSWVTIHTVVGQTGGGSNHVRTYNDKHFTNETTYTKYRWVISNCAGGSTQTPTIYELEMMVAI